MPVGLSSSPIKIWDIGPGVPELWSDKQTDKQRLHFYIYKINIKICIKKVKLNMSFSKQGISPEKLISSPTFFNTHFVLK